MHLSRLQLPIPIIALLIIASLSAAEEKKPAELITPDKWTKETIKLPPGFARDMTYSGSERVRFAPGMFKPESDTFFSYVFVFELKKGTKVDSETLNRELLKYYRGLSKTVLREQAAKVDFNKFKLKLTKAKRSGKKPTDSPMLRGKLEWIEPFATKSQQTLHLELQTWKTDKHEVVFVCVSPQPVESADKVTPEIWKQMRKIRTDFRPKSEASADSAR